MAMPDDIIFSYGDPGRGSFFYRNIWKLCRSIGFLCLASFVILLSNAHAQEGPSGLTLGVQTQVVTLDLVVADAAGNVVTDLGTQ
jgi:hypothetical protein